MEALYECCSGLDLGKRFLVACLLKGRSKETRTYNTDSQSLWELRDWLISEGCQAIAMEATGSFWHPVWNVLEESPVQLLLANPQQIKNMPGRKSDVRDAEWIADLLRHGLIKPSYVPSREQREMRELTRYRTSLLQERSREVNRIEKVLEGANIKLGTVLTDITGASGLAILHALAEGESDPKKMMTLLRGPVKAEPDAMARALTGSMGTHQRSMLSVLLERIEGLNASIQKLDAQIIERNETHEKVLQRLQTIPGVGQRTAEVIVAEAGYDVSHFPTDAHLSSWIGLAPGQNESAGKRRSSRIRPGNLPLRSALVQSAWAAVHSPHTYRHAQYVHLSVHTGKKKAIIAVAHSLGVMIYHVLASPDAEYHELGNDHFRSLDQEQIKKRAIRQLERLGYMVAVTMPPIPPAA